MDLLPLREAEEKDAAAGEEGGGENPFAAAEEGGDEAAPEAEPEADAEGDEEGTTSKKPAEPLKFPVKFNIGRVKKYNNANFISDEGELKSINKDGMVVTVKPDDVDIFVNFNDIL